MVIDSKKTKRNPPSSGRWKKGQSGNIKGRPKKEFSLTEQLRLEGDTFITRRFYLKAMQTMGYSNEEILRVGKGGKAPKDIATMTCAQLSAKLTWSDRFLEEEHSKAAKIHLDIVQQVEGKLQKVANPDGTPLQAGVGNVLVVRVVEDDEEKQG